MNEILVPVSPPVKWPDPKYRRNEPSDPSSSRYSPPPIPPRTQIADMILFYGRRSLREQIMTGFPEDTDLLDSMIDRVEYLIENWTPTLQWHRLAIVQTGRTVEWIVWQVAMEANENGLGEQYLHEAIVPFAIDLDTLPVYDVMPTMLVNPD